MAVVPNHEHGKDIFLSLEPVSANVPCVVATVKPMFKFSDLGLWSLLRFGPPLVLHWPLASVKHMFKFSDLGPWSLIRSRPARDSYAVLCLSFRISVFSVCFASGLSLYFIGPSALGGSGRARGWVRHPLAPATWRSLFWEPLGAFGQLLELL